jgi:hypothetical protein
MNQHQLLARGLVFALCAVTTGACAPAGQGEDLGSTASSFIAMNSLNPMALDATAVAPAALTPAMLSGTALDPGAISAPALAAITSTGIDGYLSRQLLAYTVGCALDGTQSFSFTWVDALGETQSVTDQGWIGLATDWADGPLGADEQTWVSACLAARVNFFGIEVQLSIRGSDAVLATSPAEVSEFPYEEGAFWGNLFTDSPAVYACDDVADDANSRSQDRVCAAGYVTQNGGIESCGIIQRLGSCDTYCEPLIGDGGQYYPACAATPILDSGQGGDGDGAGGSAGAIQPPSLTWPPITVFLQ